MSQVVFSLEQLLINMTWCACVIVLSPFMCVKAAKGVEIDTNQSLTYLPSMECVSTT